MLSQGSAPLLHFSLTNPFLLFFSNSHFPRHPSFSFSPSLYLHFSIAADQRFIKLTGTETVNYVRVERPRPMRGEAHSLSLSFIHLGHLYVITGIIKYISQMQENIESLSMKYCLVCIINGSDHIHSNIQKKTHLYTPILFPIRSSRPCFVETSGRTHAPYSRSTPRQAADLYVLLLLLIRTLYWCNYL